MTLFSKTLRETVVDRAGNRCEYCHMPTTGQVATFPIDHFIPCDQNGPTNAENLALACPHCNGHKWKHTEWTDPRSAQMAPLFNPRSQVWIDHFVWSAREIGMLEGLSPGGRATIDLLQIKSADMIALRRLLAALGLFSEIRLAAADEDE